MQLKEVVVQRDPPLVHVYDILECGRRWFRTIAFSSDATHCLHTLRAAGAEPPHARDPRGRPKHSRHAVERRALMPRHAERGAGKVEL